MEIRFLIRYLITIYYLRPKQIYYRFFYKFYRPSKPKINEIKISRLKKIFFPNFKKKTYLNNNTFTFLNKKNKIKINSLWYNPKYGKLWLYNLNYFDFLNTSENNKSNTKKNLNLIKSWINNNPYLSSIAWDPYPTSLRIVNLIKFCVSNTINDQQLNQSIFLQSHYLTKKIEWHIMGNHIIANAKALVFAGIYFNCSESKKFLNLGLSILDREISEQILNDGGHFELSTMYHNIIINDFIDIVYFSKAQKTNLPKLFENKLILTLRKMVNWMLAMEHPDKKISFFNDAAFEVAPDSKFILGYARKINLLKEKNLIKKESIFLKDSGYISLSKKDLKLIMDVGKLGPEYLMAHSHADTLSLEISLFNKRFVVNGGVSSYDKLKDRLYERSNLNHSTITVDDKNSSDVWDFFRTAKRAKPIQRSLSRNREQVAIKCSHDGYSNLFNNCIVTRNATLKKDSLSITDSVSKISGKNIFSKFIFHPDVRIKSLTKNKLVLKIKKKSGITIIINKGNFEIKNTLYMPEFGKKIKTKCLIVHFRDYISDVTFIW